MAEFPFDPHKVRYHYKVPPSREEDPANLYEQYFDDLRRAAKDAVDNMGKFAFAGCPHYNTIRLEWPTGYGEDDWGCVDCHAALEEDEYGNPRAIRR